jgi:ferritin
MLAPSMARAFAFAPTRLASQSMRTTAVVTQTFSTAIKNTDASVADTPEDRVSNKLVALMNGQITKEFSASQLYLAGSIWCKSQELDGMASYMLKESADERAHALMFVQFCLKKEIPVALQELVAPPSSWESAEALWTDLLHEEEENTRSLFRVNDEANAVHDYAISAFLQPLHMEQVESEEAMRGVLAKVRDEIKTPGLIRMLDSELGSAE